MKAVGLGVVISFFLLFVSSIMIAVDQSAGLAPAAGSGLLIVGAAAFLRWNFVRNRKPVAATHVCMHCHSRIVPSKQTTRNGAVTFILFMFFVIPAILYVLVSKDRLVCTECGAGNPVPLDAPAAQALLAA